MDIIYSNREKPYIFDNYLRLNEEAYKIVKTISQSSQPYLSVSTFGQALFYIQSPYQPQKQTLLLIHGYGATSLNWVRLIQKVKNKYNCISIDVPGTGLSSKKFQWSIKQPTQKTILQYYNSRIMNFIKKKKLKDIVLCCHSFGGFIGSYIVSKNESYFNRVILLSPFPGNQNFINYSNMFVNAIQLIMYAFNIYPQKTYQIGYVQTHFLKTTHILHNLNTWTEYLTIVGKANRESSSQQNFFTLFSKIKNQKYNISKFLKDVSLPILFLYGENDWMPYESIKILKLKKPNVFLRIVPKIDHQVLISDRIYKYF